MKRLVSLCVTQHLLGKKTTWLDECRVALEAEMFKMTDDSKFRGDFSGLVALCPTKQRLFRVLREFSMSDATVSWLEMLDEKDRMIKLVRNKALTVKACLEGLSKIGEIIARFPTADPEIAMHALKDAISWINLADPQEVEMEDFMRRASDMVSQFSAIRACPLDISVETRYDDAGIGALGNKIKDHVLAWTIKTRIYGSDWFRSVGTEEKQRLMKANRPVPIERINAAVKELSEELLDTSIAKTFEAYNFEKGHKAFDFVVKRGSSGFGDVEDMNENMKKLFGTHARVATHESPAVPTMVWFAIVVGQMGGAHSDAIFPSREFVQDDFDALCRDAWLFKSRLEDEGVRVADVNGLFHGIVLNAANITKAVLSERHKTAREFLRCTDIEPLEALRVFVQDVTRRQLDSQAVFNAKQSARSESAFIDAMGLSSENAEKARELFEKTLKLFWLLVVNGDHEKLDSISLLSAVPHRLVLSRAPESWASYHNRFIATHSSVHKKRGKLPTEEEIKVRLDSLPKDIKAEDRARGKAALKLTCELAAETCWWLALSNQVGLLDEKLLRVKAEKDVNAWVVV